MHLLLALLVWAAPLRTERVPVLLTGGKTEITLARSAAGEFVRLESEGAAPSRVWWNGAEISRARSGEWDVSGFLRAGAPNVVRAEGGTNRLWLVHGPRVYVSCLMVSGASVTVCIRNTLDNTVNVDVDVELREPGASAPTWTRGQSLTVPPDTVLPVEFASGQAAKSFTLRATVLKHTEAVEGEYEIEETLTQK